MKTHLLQRILDGAVIFLLCAVTAACAREETPAEALPSPPAHNPAPTAVAEPTSAPPTMVTSPELSLEPTTDSNQPTRIQYQLSADLDYHGHLLAVDQRIEIPHPGDVPVEEIVLVVPPRAWPGVFSLEEVSLEGKAALLEYSLEGVRLTIRLREDWQPKESRTLILKYTLVLPKQNAREGYGPSPFGYTSRQTNLVDWYPMVPPFSLESGWVVHDPWIFGEYLVYPAADFEVALGISNSPDVVVAASARETDHDNLLSYRLENARNFVFSISPDYQIREQRVGETLVRGYAFSFYQIPGQAAFETTVEALELFTEVYGPYQQSALSVVQADFNHGMEYEGLFFLSKAMFDSYNGTKEDFLIIIAAHETAHQWWYGQVANDQALEPWLDEALCTYSELVFLENRYPEAVPWWWYARIEFNQPQGWIDRPIYQYNAPLENNYLNYRNTAYLRGAVFLSRLREEMGEAQFFAFLREYRELYQGKIVTGEDFFGLLSEYQDPQSLDWLREFFSQQ